ncbi:MAG TPA: tetratricopeptide repeat protein [Bacteroidales bacterium]|nr:tetratricopeptide repeat protein [Bacteroidales bacterium]
MKRTIFALIICISTVTITYGQARDVRRANTQHSRGNIAAAKQFIDAALNDEAALQDSYTFILKSRIYMDIFNSQDTAVNALHPNPLQVADEALQRARETDKIGLRVLEIEQHERFLSELLYNKAVVQYNAKDFLEASRSFLRSFQVAEFSAAIDTTTLYNAALAAELGGDINKAKTHYARLIELNYPQPFLYSSMGNITMVLGDTAKALEYITLGRSKFPDDLNLLFSEANIYIFTRQSEKARQALNTAIERDPNNPNLHFALGANFDNVAQDTLRTLEERQFAYNEAINAYSRAIELDPNYFDAIYNLGVIYFNEGIRIFEAADARLRKNPTAAGFREYEREEKRFQEQWLKAQPYLELAINMIDINDPNYEVVVVSLLQLYARTNQAEKLQEMQEIYDSLTGNPQ